MAKKPLNITAVRTQRGPARCGGTLCCDRQPFPASERRLGSTIAIQPTHDDAVTIAFSQGGRCPPAYVETGLYMRPPSILHLAGEDGTAACWRLQQLGVGYPATEPATEVARAWANVPIS